jgi:O-antigen/teichoic acid export membrane protein
MATERAALPSLSAQAFWLLAAKTLGFALTLALPLVLVRSLSQADFGVYKQAFLLVGTATTVLPLGFGMSAFYFLPRERGAHGAVVLHILLIHAAVGLAAASLLMAWPGVLTALFGSDALVPYAVQLGGVIATWTIASFLEIIAVARQDIRASTAFIIGSQVSKTLFFVIAAVAAGSVGALIDAALVQGVAQTAVLLLYVNAMYPQFWSSFDASVLRTQASYALPLGLSGLVLKFQNDLPHYFVAHAFGASAYALFAVGVFNLPLIGLLRESVGSVMLPRVSRLEQEQDPGQIVDLVARVARKLALFYFPMYVFLLVVGREFVTVLFTSQYLASWPVFAVYLTVIPFGVIVLDPITRAYAGQRFFILKVRLALFAAMIGVFALGMQRLGLLGTVAVMVIVQVAGTFAAGARLWRVMGLRAADAKRFGILGRIARDAVVAGAACGVIRLAVLPAGAHAVVLVGAVTYAVAYAIAILADGILEPEEWFLVRRVIPRAWMPAQPNVPC